MTAVLEADNRGLACPAGGFWIDPWARVDTALITHAHADHARPGMGRYHCAQPCEPLLRRRVHKNADIVSHPYGERFAVGDAKVSFHPSGHCLGAAQVRVEVNGTVAVAAGDYKRASDPTCEPFEVVPCDVFITEATFALPIYRWQRPATVADEMLSWWAGCRAADKAAIVFCYALGKAQRVLAELGLAAQRAGERIDWTNAVRTHGAIEPMLTGYRELGVDLPPTRRVREDERALGRQNPFAGSLVLAPPSAAGSPWMRRFGAADRFETAFASGWMRVRGIRRRRRYDRGFVISDHADWPELIRTCEETGASRVLCTHGNSATLAAFLNERAQARGDTAFRADVLETAYRGEDGSEPDEEAAA